MASTMHRRSPTLTLSPAGPWRVRFAGPISLRISFLRDDDLLNHRPRIDAIVVVQAPAISSGRSAPAITYNFIELTL